MVPIRNGSAQTAGQAPSSAFDYVCRVSGATARWRALPDVERPARGGPVPAAGSTGGYRRTPFALDLHRQGRTCRDLRSGRVPNFGQLRGPTTRSEFSDACLLLRPKGYGVE